MIKVNGFKLAPQRIFDPEWDAIKVNTRKFKTHCNAYFARIGIPICDYADGIKSHARAEKRRKERANR